MPSEKAYDLEQRFTSHAYAHRYILPATSGPSIGTSMTTVPGLSASLDAGVTYQLHAFVAVNITASGGTLTYQFGAAGGLTRTSMRLVVIEFTTGISPTAGTATALSTAITGSVVGTGLSDRWVTYDCRLDVGVAGTLNVQAALSAGSATFYNYSSYLDVIQDF
jgi:hypothetical protein